MYKALETTTAGKEQAEEDVNCTVILSPEIKLDEV